MKRIKFVRPSRPYMAGDLAGFPDHIADRYVEAGYAVVVNVKKPRRSPAEAPKTKPADAPVKK